MRKFSCQDWLFCPLPLSSLPCSPFPSPSPYLPSPIPVSMRATLCNFDAREAVMRRELLLHRCQEGAGAAGAPSSSTAGGGYGAAGKSLSAGHLIRH